MVTIVTKEGDMVDEIVFQHYGSISGYLEKVLELNRHLASYGPVLPSGIKIKLPEIEEIKTDKKEISLWNI